ncbi:hypothetical protein K1719_045370 [Acacia pycnantha]|nr:hypothetical protein K1719_045370 [Acacia pycnantha]
MKCAFVKLEIRFLFRFLLRSILRSFHRVMGCFLSCLRASDDEDHLLPTSQHKSRGVVTSRNPLSLFLSRAFKRKEDTSRLDRDNLVLGSQRVDKEEPEQVQSSVPATPIKFCEGWENGKDSLEHTPCSSAYIALDTQFGSRCLKDERTKQSLPTENSAASPSPPTADIQRRSKTLRFECETDLSSRGYKQSPYPTPLKISDDMQTPGTVYPASFLNQPNDNKPRVRSQFLHSDNHLAKSISQSEIPEEEDSSGELSSASEHVQNATPTPKKGLKEVSYENECELEASLSWLKNASVINEEKEASHNQIPNLWESPEENPQITSPKVCYGNGIPNTTNKYKEDKKVNWHATPFEVRLERALSDKSFISQRNHLYGKSNTFENEDTDTALSQLQLDSSKSVVS